MKFFTLEQAEKLLPTVERLVKKAVKLRERIAWLLETNDVFIEVMGEDGFHQVVTAELTANKHFHRLNYQLYKVLEDLEHLGIFVTDVDEGVVDFPFKMNGEPAFLSWQLGDERIYHWHSGDDDDLKPVFDVDSLLDD